MSLIKKVVNLQINEEETMMKNPVIKDRKTTIQRARKEAGEEVRNLQKSLEDGLSVRVRQPGPNKWTISISLEGNTLRVSDIRRMLKEDPMTEDLNII